MGQASCSSTSKKQSDYEEKADKEDVAAFTQLHSWYKHLPVQPSSTFCAIPLCGKQRGQPIHAEDVASRDELHWHFCDLSQAEELNGWTDLAVVSACIRFPIHVNCFLSGFANLPVLLSRNADTWQPWASTFYPRLYEQLGPMTIKGAKWWDVVELEPFSQIVRLERDRQVQHITCQLVRLRQELGSLGYTNERLVSVSQAKNAERKNRREEARKWVKHQQSRLFLDDEPSFVVLHHT